MRELSRIISLVIVTLILTSFVNPIQALPEHTAIIAPSVQHVLQSHEEEISLLVASEHSLTTDEVLEMRAFGTVTTVAGPIAVLHAHITDLDKIGHLPFVSRIEGSHALSVTLNKSVPDVGADVVWREVKDPVGRNVTGAGVVIGFVDTGIDTTHPDFHFPNGSSKILYLWDQTTAGRPPSGFDYGFECSSADIRAETCPEYDSFGHGTHVAGIAASTGLATGNFTGVAPGADIIFVKSGHEVCSGASWTFDTAQILDGVNYIVKKATQIGRRAVISLSLGGNTGGHDGTDPLEQGLGAIVKSGTPIVVAAGNGRLDNDHARGQLSQGSSITLNVLVNPTTDDLVVDIWYALDDQFDATLVTPQGQTYKIPTPKGGASSAFGNITAISVPGQLGRELYFEVSSNETLPSQNWSVTLTAIQVKSKGDWDAWIDTSTCSSPGAEFISSNGYAVDPYDTLGIPGTAREVVTVGAYTTRNSWQGINGQTYDFADPIGSIAPFSSLGPTRDGRIKPDVVAPGQYIASARSRNITRRGSDPDLFHTILRGTSMAAPHVAGTIALMLQYAPNLAATDFPRILRETARLDAYTKFDAEGSPIWGFGKIDARTATGFYRLTLFLNEIPDNVMVPVSVDDNPPSVVAGHSWFDLYFPKGKEHTITLGIELQGTPGTRYTLENRVLTLDASTVKIMNYTVQYLLTVTSQFGPTTGSGWYNSNTTVKAGAPTHVNAGGLLGLVGAEYTLDHWVTNDGKIASDSVRMTQPESLTAVYVLTYPLQTYVIVSIIIAVVGIVVVLLAKRRPGRGPATATISS